MKLHQIVAVGLIAFALSGCTRSGGVLVTEDQAAQFEKGKATYAEVINRLGKPTTTMSFANGTKAASYSFAEAKTKPETFVPIVGLFAGGADLKTNSVTFMFNQEGVLTDYMSSVSQSAPKMGTSTQPTEGQLQKAP
ncbi:MAG: hypothetical protein AB7M05_08610 [Alphaproteobacteria bacterium]